MVVMAFINWFKPVTVYVTNYDLYFNQFLSFDYIFFVSKSLGAIQSYSFLHADADVPITTKVIFKIVSMANVPMTTKVIIKIVRIANVSK
jgi:hypothetical protein